MGPPASGAYLGTPVPDLEGYQAWLEELHVGTHRKRVPWGVRQLQWQGWWQLKQQSVTHTTARCPFSAGNNIVQGDCQHMHAQLTEQSQLLLLFVSYDLNAHAKCQEQQGHSLAYRMCTSPLRGGVMVGLLVERLPTAACRIS